MRELKFRAFSPSENKMYEFDLNSYMRTNEGAQEDLCSSEAAMNGLMQLTGLKDKNGKEIYESDTVSFRNGERMGEIKWQQQLCAFYISYTVGNKSFYSELKPDYGDGNGFFLTDTEVIGNVYENPELLKK